MLFVFCWGNLCETWGHADFLLCWFFFFFHFLKFFWSRVDIYNVVLWFFILSNEMEISECQIKRYSYWWFILLPKEYFKKSHTCMRFLLCSEGPEVVLEVEWIHQVFPATSWFILIPLIASPGQKWWTDVTANYNYITFEGGFKGQIPL